MATSTSSMCVCGLDIETVKAISTGPGGGVVCVTTNPWKQNKNMSKPANRDNCIVDGFLRDGPSRISGKTVHVTTNAEPLPRGEPRTTDRNRAVRCAKPRSTASGSDLVLGAIPRFI